MYTIYTIGGGAILETLFNAVALTLSGSQFAQIAKITALTGLLWVIVTTTMHQDWAKNAKWFMVMVVSYNVMLLPKVKVRIADRLQPAVPRFVENVPFVLASFASFSSSIGNELTELFDKVFSLPDDMRYNKSGFLMGAELLDTVGRIQITDPTLRDNAQAFMVRCVQRDIQLGKFTMKEILGSSNLFNFLKAKGLTNLRSVTFLEDRSGGGYNPQLYTCQEAFNKLSTALNTEEKPRIIKKLASTLFGSRAGDVLSSSSGSAYQSALLAMLPASYDYFTRQSQSAVDIINHHLILSALYDGVENENPDYPSVRARIQTEQTYQATGKLAKEFLPFIRIIFEVILYGMFPVIVLLMLLPNAAMILFNYVQAIVWVQSWGPVYSLIHFASSFLLKLSLSSEVSAGYNGYSITTVHDVISRGNALASYMTILVPFIAWMVLRGFQNLVHMGSTVLQPVTSSAGAAASEMATGNFALGNVSMRNISHDTYGAWKYNHGFDVSTGSSAQRPDLMTERFGNDGTHTYDENQSISKMKFDVGDHYSESQQFTSAASIANRMGEDKKQSEMQSFATIGSKVVESRRFHDQVDTGNRNFEEQSQTVHEQALSKVEHAAQEFAQSHRMNKETVTGVMLSLGGNYSGKKLPVPTIGGGLNAIGKLHINGEYRALSSDEVSDLQKVMSSKDLQDALRTTEQAIQSRSLNLRDEQGNSISDSVRADYNQAHTYANEAERYFGQSKEFSKRAEESQSSGYTISRSLTQDVVEYVRDNFGSDKVNDEAFMTQVAMSKDFKDMYHYKSALAQLNGDKDLPSSMDSIKPRFDSNKHLQEHATNNYNSFKPEVAEHHLDSRNRTTIDNSHLIRTTSDTMQKTHDQIEHANVANDKFEGEVKELAHKTSAAKALFRKNRADADVFDEESKD